MPVTPGSATKINRVNGVAKVVPVTAAEVSTTLKDKVFESGVLLKFADGKLYLVGREGDMAVVKAGPTFEQVGKNKLPDVFTGSPAVSGGRIYLRGFNYLWAIGTK